MIPRSPQAIEASRKYVSDVWNNVWARNYASLTMQQQSQIYQAFVNGTVYNPNDPNNLLTAIFTLQDSRNGNLTAADVDAFLQTWLNQMRQATMQYSGMPAYGNVNPIATGYNTGMPMMGMPSAGIPMGMGMGYQNPMMQRPMMGMPAYNPAMSAPMATPTQLNMASMYDLKPTQPAMQYPKPQAAPQVPVPISNTPSVPPVGAMPSAGVPTPVTVPTMKVTPVAVPYTEPTFVSTRPYKHALASGKISQYTKNGEPLATYKLGSKSDTDNIHGTIATLVDDINPTFMTLKYRTARTVDIKSDVLWSAMGTIQKTINDCINDEEETYTQFQILDKVLNTMNDKERGVSRFVENIIVEKFNQYVYTLDAEHGALITDSCDKIIEMGTTIKNVAVLNIAESALERVFKDLCEMEVVDVPEVTEPKTEGDEEEKKVTKKVGPKCIVKSEEKTIIYTKLSFPGMIGDNGQSKTYQIDDVPLTIDNSAPDNDLEYFLKVSEYKDYTVATMIIDDGSVLCNYLVVIHEDRILVRKAGIY